ncbi:MAG TPA: hypothetical protein VMU28_08230 [Terriglobales bacterium]|nr:hypothetical protein [Terriglobales bacterium]
MTSFTVATQSDDKAYLELVSSQVQRVTQELNKLEKLLQAGMVERAILVEFRQAVDQIRKTSWEVERSMEKSGR